MVFVIFLYNSFIALSMSHYSDNETVDSAALCPNLLLTLIEATVNVVSGDALQSMIAAVEAFSIFNISALLTYPE